MELDSKLKKNHGMVSRLRATMSKVREIKELNEIWCNYVLVYKFMSEGGYVIDTKFEYVSYAFWLVEKYGFILWKWKKDFKVCVIIKLETHTHWCNHIIR